jgi:hypothetical protein
MGESKALSPSPLPSLLFLQFFDILIFKTFDHMIVKSCFHPPFLVRNGFYLKSYRHFFYFIVNFWILTENDTRKRSFFILPFLMILK